MRTALGFSAGSDSLLVRVLVSFRDVRFCDGACDIVSATEPKSVMDLVSVDARLGVVVPPDGRLYAGFSLMGK